MPANPTPPVPKHFSFRVSADATAAPVKAGPAPWLSVGLELPTGHGAPLTADGLVDTGASVSVLPYRLGLALGATWPEGIQAPLKLAGNLAGHAAYPLLLVGRLSCFAPVRLAFAWTQAEQIPLILGKMNFFAELDVCFFRSRLVFEVSPKRG